MKLTHRTTILITGSSRGIGSAIAQRLAGPDTNIIINYVENEDRAKETALACQAKGAQTLVFQADVGNPVQVASLFDAIEKNFTGVDILVNNAGISVYGMIQDITLDDWNKVFATNVNGMFLTTQKATPHMVSQKWGRIINISSMWGIVGASCESLYGSSKGAINAFTKSCAKELSYSGITVNAFAPGVVDTEMLDQLGDEVKSALVDEIPQKRFMTPEECAEWIAFLLSEQAASLTGQIISPNGGLVFY